MKKPGSGKSRVACVGCSWSGVRTSDDTDYATGRWRNTCPKCGGDVVYEEHLKKTMSVAKNKAMASYFLSTGLCPVCFKTVSGKIVWPRTSTHMQCHRGWNNLFGDSLDAEKERDTLSEFIETFERNQIGSGVCSDILDLLRKMASLFK
jgi:hypothetical protein